MTPPKVAVLGATGFIGSHVLRSGRAGGTDITPLTMARVHDLADRDGTVAAAAARWRDANRAAFDDLCHLLAPFDVVVNAAGDPRSGCADVSRLRTLNAVLPAIVSRAAGVSGVRRLVHVSSAAVQGRLDPLDESDRLCPQSPYASSKADGERMLLEADPARQEIPAELVVYRPTSVQAIGRRPTTALAGVVRLLPVVPVAGSGMRPVPVALLDNVAAGIVFAATTADCGRIALQPDEGVTARRLVELLGGHAVGIPPHLVEATVESLARLARPSSYLTSRLRWLELVVRGQGVRAKVLQTAGFTLPAGDAGWQALGRALRQRSG